MVNVQKIDELYLNNHYNLSSGDDCYFFISYAVKQGFGYSHENQLIYNLKKGMDKKGTYEWRHKENAIIEAAGYFAEANVCRLFPDNPIYVPIPPSKAKGDPEYDDCVVRILKNAYGGALDVRELVAQKKSTESYHLSGQKRDVEELVSNMYIDEKFANDVTGDIVIFDDVLSSGAHFKAVSKVLNERFGEAIKIHGLFLARSLWTQNDFESSL